MVAYETESPQFDAARQRLVFDEESSTPAEELLAAPPLRIYRVIETAARPSTETNAARPTTPSSASTCRKLLWAFSCG